MAYFNISDILVYPNQQRLCNGWIIITRTKNTKMLHNTFPDAQTVSCEHKVQFWKRFVIKHVVKTQLPR